MDSMEGAAAAATAPEPAPPPYKSPIRTAGVFDGIPLEIYHRQEICPGHSVSSSGLKLIDPEFEGCPELYWWNSPLNPQREPEEEKPHLQLGKLLHDLLADGEDYTWRRWHITPAGYSESFTKKFEAAIAECKAARDVGLGIIGAREAEQARAMFLRVARDQHARLMFMGGKAEQTLAWKDKETGIWLRVRPDVLPKTRQWIPDYKTTLSAHPNAFDKAIDNYGYHLSAAMYLDGIREIFGETPKAFVFVAQEKKPPYITQLFQLDVMDEGYGRSLYRRALRTLAKCLDEDRWPGYSGAIHLTHLPDYTRKRLELDIKTGLLDVPTYSEK